MYIHHKQLFARILCKLLATSMHMRSYVYGFVTMTAGMRKENIGIQFFKSYSDPNR